MTASNPTVPAAHRRRTTGGGAGRLGLVPALILLTACGGRAPAASDRSAFPVTARDALGSTVTVRSEPHRIVSLAPAMTEVLFALGLEKRIVGVTEYCDYPPQARSKPKVGGIVNPSVERILAQKPDLVIGMRLNPKPVLRSLAKAGVPIFAAEPKSIKDVVATITTVGALTGTRDAARALASRMQARLRDVERKVQDTPRPTVALLYSDNPLWIAGAGTFPDHVIRLAGGRNAAANITGYKQYDVEALLARNPDVILLTSMKGGDDAAHLRNFMRRPSMRGLSAVKGKRVYMIDADLVDRAGPRIVDGVAEMAAKLHPKAFGRSQ